LNIKTLHRYILILFWSLFAASCIPPLEGPPPDPRSFEISNTDLFDLGGSLPYFDDFMYTMKITHLDTLLKGGPYTVFAPVQSSFSKFRKKYKITHMEQFPKDKLSEILRYHIIPGQYSLADFPEGYLPTLAIENTTGNPISLLIEKYDFFRINGRYLLDEPDLGTINGYIHSIGIVLEIPDLVDHLAINRDFSLIRKILNRRDIDPIFVMRLSNDDPVTFLAPANAAINSIIENHPVWQSVDDMPAEMLNNMMLNHIVDNKNIVLKDNFQDISMTTMSGREITVHIDYPRWKVMDGTTKIAELNIRDIQAVNGIIHQVDRVLLPE
jgi:uncharacterized surface protein with fasciclin (FAS1) repeats